MVNIFVYFWLMFNMFLLTFSASLWMFFIELGIVLEWLMISINSFNFEFYILVDWVSLLFISIIFLISSMIMLYSYIYMEKEMYIYRFIYLVILFIMSMILMIISPNIVSIMFGWDGLGVVSYCLVIFYQNYISYNSGMVTVLCNRVGDVGLLMAIAMMMFLGSWSVHSLQNKGVIIVMLLVASITKSAQIPFSSWLPSAMAAPTPVSALVHSSTLVTAGVYLMIRFNKFLMESELNFILFFLSVVTMFMSGLMALIENDLKKIIALSTLSQLGLMMLILSMGSPDLAYYHLLTHAVFKSLLFMCAGVIIHSMMNVQDIRLLGNLNEMLPFTMMSFYISSLALSGFPFMAGFYSKDLIFEMIYSLKINMFMLLLIGVSIMLTVLYSIRLFYYLFFNNMKFYSFVMVKEDRMMNISMMGLVILSIIVGACLNWMFFFDSYNIFLSEGVKLITISGCLLGVMVGSGSVILSFFFFNIYYLSVGLGTMWFLDYFYLWGYKSFNFWSVEIFKFDKSWLEFSSAKSVSVLLNHKWVVWHYKVYMFGFIGLFFYMMVFIFI
uniref:NADH dehydrogenase subunit 5 n=1 Tax=Stenamma megamanni TaxID=1504014 RepID=UPI001FCD9E64|nr:NADH dehydrogenase subunit 5 [Stenamma megamanni]UNZ99562.1 NADH dehydrogenase subunit 5 [Stenamma megamanni]